MPQKVGVLLKVFSTEKFKEDFLDGNLYMNTIDYFRCYEEEIDGNIADKNEALSGWLLPNEFSITIEANGEKHVIDPNDMSAPATISLLHHTYANVFCMTLLHSHEIDMSRPTTEDEDKTLRGYFTLPREIEGLGEHLVVITDTESFLSRVRDSFQSAVDQGEAYWYAAKEVTYYDAEANSLLLKKDMDAPFYKQNKYAHQSEFRLCLMKHNPLNNPCLLNIGSIRNIADEMRTEEFNGSVKINGASI